MALFKTEEAKIARTVSPEFINFDLIEASVNNRFDSISKGSISKAILAEKERNKSGVNHAKGTDREGVAIGSKTSFRMALSPTIQEF